MPPKASAEPIKLVEEVFAPPVETPTQKFLAGLYAESRKPHYGHTAKEWLGNLLLRAQEAGIYTPPEDT